jgi:electron transfer flavoprotein alpha/beta subunit
MEPEDGGVLRVHRRLDGGRREVLLVQRPAVVSVEAPAMGLRRAGLPATLASGRAAIPVARGLAATARRSESGYRAPSRTGPGRANLRARPAPHCAGRWS